MDLSQYTPAVQKLGGLGDTWDERETLDYRELGITETDIPDLVTILRSINDFWDFLWDDEEEELDIAPIFWTPVHAWRALGQLRSVETLPHLIRLLELIDEKDSDLIQDDLPEVFAIFGPDAITDLTDYLCDAKNEMWARIGAASSLHRIGQKHPQSRESVIDSLVLALNGYAQNHPTLNGFLMSCLMELQAVRATPLVEKVFAAEAVDESVAGDFEDFQVAIGLLDKRLTVPFRNSFLDDFQDLETQVWNRQQREAIQKNKKKCKQEKQSRKVTRKKARKKKK